MKYHFFHKVTKEKNKEDGLFQSGMGGFALLHEVDRKDDKE